MCHFLSVNSVSSQTEMIPTSQPQSGEDMTDEAPPSNGKIFF